MKDENKTKEQLIKELADLRRRIGTEDITELKKIEEELTMKAQLLDSATDSIFLLDSNDQFIYVNEAAYKSRGYEKDELLSMKLHELNSPEYAKLIEARSKELVEKRQSTFESAHICKDGSIMPVEVHVRIIDSAGKKFALSIARDITERKQAEEALRKSEIKYRIVADNTSDWEFWLSPEGEFIYVSPSCERITSYSKEEFLSDPDLMNRIICSEDLPIYEGHLHEAVEEMKPELVQFRIVRRDGEQRWIEHNCQPVFDADGKFLGIRGSNRDVTQRRQAEEAIKHFAHLTASIINSLPGIFYLIDEYGHFIRWNENFERVTGYSAEDISKMTNLDFIGKDEKQLVAEKLQEVLTKGETSVEVYLVSRAGKKTLFFFTGARMLVDGKKYVVGMGIDITERKRAEDALRQMSEELIRSNADLRQFSYVASHDLQEPLRVISTCVQLLVKRHKGKSSESLDELVKYIVDNAKRMQELIRDILDYSRMETGKKTFKPVDFSQAVEEVLVSLKVAMVESGAIVTYDRLPTIVADKVQMNSLFQNLIDNAIKFHNNETPKVHISAERKGDEWIFSVQDNGIGIEPEFTDKIFDVFKRLHTREEYPGTGIGLAICKKIVEHHGGRIWFESEPGKGSTFYFTIPDRGQTS